MRWRGTGMAALAALGMVGAGAMAAVERDVQAMVLAAETAGRAGMAQKTSAVDARPAVPGEIVVTMILGEGKETQSKPAEAGDWVVRNRCPETGNEQYLVKAARFSDRYAAAPGEPDSAGWRPFRPLGKAMRYVVVNASDGEFTFTAPWGEAMVAKPGDAIVQDPADPKDTYRIAAASFACTYEVTKPPA